MGTLITRPDARLCKYCIHRQGRACRVWTLIALKAVIVGASDPACPAYEDVEEEGERAETV